MTPSQEKHRAILHAAAGIARERLKDPQCDVETIANQLKQSAELVLADIRAKRPSRVVTYRLHKEGATA